MDAGGTIYQTTFNYNGDDAVTYLTVIDLDSATDPVTIDLAGSPVNHALVGRTGPSTKPQLRTRVTNPPPT